MRFTPIPDILATIMIPPGRRLGQYVVEEVIGGGGFGTVYRARHRHVRRTVAIKVPNDVAYTRHLKTEGVLQHELHHPRIVRTLGLNLTTAPPYFVMEYMSGGNLRQLFETTGQLSLKRILTIFFPILEAMAYAHDRNVAHRDLKPENILFSADGRVKVTDFGLGTVQKELTSLILSRSMMSMGEEEFAGTLEYMAPEQRRGKQGGARADIYAMGVILYELLTGDLPLGYFPLPGETRDDLPENLDHVVERSLATRTDLRYSTAGAFRDALLDVLPEGLYRTVPTSPTRWSTTAACPKCSGTLESMVLGRSAAHGLRSDGLLGEFRLRRLLAEGDRIDVWLADHVHLPGKPGLAKIAHNPEAATELHQEGIVLSSDHPGLPRLYSLDPSADPPHLVREYATGASLEALIKEMGPLEPEDALRVLIGILRALAPLHADGRVHGAIRAPNVLFGREQGRLFLVNHQRESEETEPTDDVGAAVSLALSASGEELPEELTRFLRLNADHPASSAEALLSMLKDALREAGLETVLETLPGTRLQLPFALWERPRTVRLTEVALCSDCDGLWVDRSLIHGWSGGPETGDLPLTRSGVGTLACPVCTHPMKFLQREGEDPFVLHHCPGDGFWIPRDALVDTRLTRVAKSDDLPAVLASGLRAVADNYRREFRASLP